MNITFTVILNHLGFDVVKLHVREHNLAAQNLYFSFGFEKEKYMPNYYFRDEQPGGFLLATTTDADLPSPMNENVRPGEDVLELFGNLSNLDTLVFTSERYTFW